MTDIALKPTSQGKVRDIYDLGDKLLIVASDRISAFDYILEDEIPYKGEVLTKLSVFWFELLSSVVQNHLISTDIKDLPQEFSADKDYLVGRFMLVRKANMFPVECIVRGYLAGSSLKEYKASGTCCGIKLESGLQNSSKLPAPIYTPSTKAEIGGHDENVSLEYTENLLGKSDAHALRDTAIRLYSKAASYAATKGIIIADTKFEFGKVDDKLVLADEVLTPDSSRFWPASCYEAGKAQPSFDKQFVRDWLDANWDRSGKPPRLPKEVIQTTSAKYIQAYELITGNKFVPAKV